MQRRAFLQLGALISTVTPLGGLSLLGGCGTREPETPLAHLYGKDWVHGAYQHYADVYIEVEGRARQHSTDSYKLLSQRGVTSLTNLQAREVPFHIRVAQDEQSFRVERDVPERLTFRAGMSQAERDRATEHWKLARDHIHQDYIEVRHLDFALGNLLSQVQALRIAGDEGRIEQYRICRQHLELSQGGELPFELPYQVTKADYIQVLELLVLRLEQDRQRTAALEASMVTVGLTARATDAGSGSLAQNLTLALLAVTRDAEAMDRRSGVYPQGEALAADLQAGKALVREIQDGEEFKLWLAAQREAEDQLGRLLVILDTVTGLPTSAIYRQVMRLWRGDADYLDYLASAVSLLPGGSQAMQVVKTAVERTQEYRETYRKAVRMVGDVRDVRERLARGELDVGGMLLNTGSQYARERLDRQLVYLRDQTELDEAQQQLESLDALRGPPPEVPVAPAPE
ncbi:MAG: hypothetical protein H6718_04610 [Polyangiaceae bacterium]|nr:hypothetical protein [Polyangiaceae bacterium]MCB9609089.1 hypothetical protein [Polyangiaceae bacterium]